VFTSPTAIPNQPQPPECLPEPPIGTLFHNAQEYSKQYNQQELLQNNDLTEDLSDLFPTDFLLFGEHELLPAATPDTTLQNNFNPLDFDNGLFATDSTTINCPDPTAFYTNTDTSPSANSLTDDELANFFDTPTPSPGPPSHAPSPTLIGSAEVHHFSKITQNNHFLPSPTLSQSFPSLLSPTLSPAAISPPSQIPPTPSTPALDFIAQLPPPLPFSSPPQPSFASRKRKATEEPPSNRPKALVNTEICSDDDENKKKQKRNTAAARRYRENKARKMKELEDELAEEQQMKEYWKSQAEQQKAEADKWRTMVMVMMQKK